MHSRRPQYTVKQPAVVEGFGYWSGRDVRVEFHPAPLDSGVVFVREDVDPAARIPATVASRIETPRRTTLRSPRGTVEMVEHILAALAGLQVDNCEVRVNATEMPGVDGSAQPFVEALDRAGRVSQGAPKPQLFIREVTRLGNDEHWIEARPSGGPGLTVRYRLDYGRDNPVGKQSLSLPITMETFRRELASARTFVMKEEADWLRSQGLGSRVTARDLLVFDEQGPIENELRFPDECVRHKVLDLVGDLALAGCDVVGHIVAHKSGHRLNAEMVKILLTEGEKVGFHRRTA